MNIEIVTNLAGFLHQDGLETEHYLQVQQLWDSVLTPDQL